MKARKSLHAAQLTTVRAGWVRRSVGFLTRLRLVRRAPIDGGDGAECASVFSRKPARSTTEVEGDGNDGVRHCSWFFWSRFESQAGGVGTAGAQRAEDL